MRGARARSPAWSASATSCAGVVGELAAGRVGEARQRVGLAALEPEAQRPRLAGVRGCADDLQRHDSSHLSDIWIPSSAHTADGLERWSRGASAARRRRRRPERRGVGLRRPRCRRPGRGARARRRRRAAARSASHGVVDPGQVGARTRRARAARCRPCPPPPPAALDGVQHARAPALGVAVARRVGEQVQRHVVVLRERLAPGRQQLGEAVARRARPGVARMFVAAAVGQRERRAAPAASARTGRAATARSALGVLRRRSRPARRPRAAVPAGGAAARAARRGRRRPRAAAARARSRSGSSIHGSDAGLEVAEQHRRDRLAVRRDAPARRPAGRTRRSGRRRSRAPAGRRPSPRAPASRSPRRGTGGRARRSRGTAPPDPRRRGRRTARATFAPAASPAAQLVADVHAAVERAGADVLDHEQHVVAAGEGLLERRQQHVDALAVDRAADEQEHADVVAGAAAAPGRPGGRSSRSTPFGTTCTRSAGMPSPTYMSRTKSLGTHTSSTPGQRLDPVARDRAELPRLDQHQPAEARVVEVAAATGGAPRRRRGAARAVVARGPVVGRDVDGEPVAEPAGRPRR